MNQQQRPELTEDIVSAIIEEQVKGLESEFSQKLSQLEARLSKDFDSRLHKLSKSQAAEAEARAQSIKDELRSYIMEDAAFSIKQDVMRQASEKVKEAIKPTERSVAELKTEL